MTDLKVDLLSKEMFEYHLLFRCIHTYGCVLSLQTQVFLIILLIRELIIQLVIVGKSQLL